MAEKTYQIQLTEDEWKTVESSLKFLQIHVDGGKHVVNLRAKFASKGPNKAAESAPESPQPPCDGECGYQWGLPKCYVLRESEECPQGIAL